MIDWEQTSLVASSIGTLVAILGIAIAVVGLILETKQNNRSLGVTIIRDLEEEFYSDEMVAVRLEICCAIKKSGLSKCNLPISLSILDFFDSVGVYQEKGTIDLEITWVMFYYWIGFYWYLLQDNVIKLEKDHSGVQYYKNIRILYKKLNRFAKEHRNQPEDAEYFTPDNTFANYGDETGCFAG